MSESPAASPTTPEIPYQSVLPDVIDELWEQRAELSPADEQARAAVVGAVDAIDAGQARVAFVDRRTDEVVVDERAKRAILLAFRVLPMASSGGGDFRYDDRLPLPTRLDGVRVLPGAIVRWGAYVAPGAVLMPSFVNIGAYVDTGTMVDTWATVGSGAQIGKNVHLSGGVGIGGVLEPPSAVPVVVEDEAMIGSRCMVVGGARVRQGCMLGAGAILTPTTHVIDTETGAELPLGEAPAWSVCVGGTRPRKYPGGEFGLPCLLVLKRLPEGVRHDKSALNAILRDHGADALLARGDDPPEPPAALRAPLRSPPQYHPAGGAHGPLAGHEIAAAPRDSPYAPDLLRPHHKPGVTTVKPQWPLIQSRTGGSVARGPSRCAASRYRRPPPISGYWTGAVRPTGCTPTPGGCCGSRPSSWRGSGCWPSSGPPWRSSGRRGPSAAPPTTRPPSASPPAWSRRATR